MKKFIVPGFFTLAIICVITIGYSIRYIEIKNHPIYMTDTLKTNVSIDQLPKNIVIEPDREYFYQTRITRKYYTEGILVKQKIDTLSSNLFSKKIN